MTDTVENILDFAIRSEQAAADFYTKLAARASNEEMRKALEGFAGEELGHKARLEGVKAGKTLQPAEKKIQDLGMPGYAPGNGDTASGPGLGIAEVFYAVVEEGAITELQVQTSPLDLV